MTDHHASGAPGRRLTREHAVYRDIARRARLRFAALVDPHLLTFLSEEVGEGFHLKVEVRLDLVEARWSEAIDRLADAVKRLGPRTFFDAFERSPQVEFASGTSLPRMLVVYLPETEDEDGKRVPDLWVARFDVRGVSYQTKGHG